MNIKSWVCLFLYTCMWLGGAYVMGNINKLPDGLTKNISLGISLIATFLGARCFFKKLWEIKN